MRLALRRGERVVSPWVATTRSSVASGTCFTTRTPWMGLGLRRMRGQGPGARGRQPSSVGAVAGCALPCASCQPNTHPWPEKKEKPQPACQETSNQGQCFQKFFYPLSFNTSANII